jgi:putative acetyltransferase
VARLLIRHERPADFDAIHALTLASFARMPFSDGTEADIVRKLRADGDLALSLVAEDGDKLLGHVAFSPVTIDGEDNGWFGLGPISVQFERQRQGIGRTMALRGLALLRERGANGCALIRDPEIYSRFGFVSSGHLAYRNLDASLIQHLSFKGDVPRGVLKFAPAFEA